MSLVPDSLVSASEPPNLPAVISQVRASGARGLIFGETHESISPLALVQNSLPHMAAEGYGTLYIEMPRDLQPLYDSAAANEPGARDRMRALHDFAFRQAGSLHGQFFSAMIETAMDNGLKVKAVDLPLHRINTISLADQRLQVADPSISDYIKSIDDGKPWTMVVGSAHTYEQGHGGQCVSMNETIDKLSSYAPKQRKANLCRPEDFLMTDEGGINKRTGAVAIDVETVRDATAILKKTDGSANDWVFIVPSHPLQEKSVTHKNDMDPVMLARGQLLMSAYELRAGAGAVEGAMLQAMLRRSADAAEAMEKLIAQKAASPDLNEQQNKLAGLVDVTLTMIETDPAAQKSLSQNIDWRSVSNAYLDLISPPTSSAANVRPAAPSAGASSPMPVTPISP